MDGPDGKVDHAELKIGNSHIMLADENPSMGQGSHQRGHDRRKSGEPLCLPSRRGRVVERAAAEGAKILKPVEDQFSGDRSVPAGSVRTSWGVATHRGRLAPKELEERMKNTIRKRRRFACEARGGTAMPRPRLALLPDPRVRHRVQHIRQEVHGHIRQPNRQDAALHQEIIAGGDGVDGEAADAGPGEDLFGDDGAGE